VLHWLWHVPYREVFHFFILVALLVLSVVKRGVLDDLVFESWRWLELIFDDVFFDGGVGY
jgi:hypothetical protein